MKPIPSVLFPAQLDLIQLSTNCTGSQCRFYSMNQCLISRTSSEAAAEQTSEISSITTLGYLRSRKNLLKSSYNVPRYHPPHYTPYRLPHCSAGKSNQLKSDASFLVCPWHLISLSSVWVDFFCAYHLLHSFFSVSGGVPSI